MEKRKCLTIEALKNVLQPERFVMVILLKLVLATFLPIFNDPPEKGNIYAGKIEKNTQRL